MSVILDQDPQNLRTYLTRLGYLKQGEEFATEIPGDGNMNFTLRVKPEKSSHFVLKQARPWVEKYPDLEAPVERIHVEHNYYQHINALDSLSSYSPQIFYFDTINSVLIMEDLGDTLDYRFVYDQISGFDQAQIIAPIDYLNYLKEVPIQKEYPTNLALRKLNHEHIFSLPFRKNSFDLESIQPGLSSLAHICNNDQLLIRKVDKLGTEYLGHGECLLHGDFYPGSLLNTDAGLKVIDAEFSFLGPEEWDISIFLAHMFMAMTPPELIRVAFKRFRKSNKFDHAKLAGFTGTEIIRRIVGLAQLPLNLSIPQKSILIEDAIEWIKRGKIHTLSDHEQSTLLR